MKLGISILALTLALGVTTAEARSWGNHGNDHNGNEHTGWQQNMGPQGMGGLAMFGELDTDKDGFITEAELDARAQTRFDEADTNADGFLDAAELTAQGDAMRAQMMQNRPQNGNVPMANEDRMTRFADRAQEMIDRMVDRFDIDDDGKMSFAEMQAARPGLMFDRFDATGDGKISESEWHEATQHRGGHGPRQDRR